MFMVIYVQLKILFEFIINKSNTRQKNKNKDDIQSPLTSL